MLSQLRNHRITPLSPLDFAADVGTHLPVQFDQLRVDRLNGLLSSAVNKREYFIETHIR
jgi:hypothetical protein